MGENERRLPKSRYSLDQILALTLDWLGETTTLEKVCFGACESSPGSAKVTTFSLGGGSTLGDLGQGCVHHIAH